ncbi:hypothetical protein ACYPKM_03610 [Pseudomonas aeruginosa]
MVTINTSNAAPMMRSVAAELEPKLIQQLDRLTAVSAKLEGAVTEEGISEQEKSSIAQLNLRCASYLVDIQQVMAGEGVWKKSSIIDLIELLDTFLEGVEGC